jgi:hypothetical protein
MRKMSMQENQNCTNNSQIGHRSRHRNGATTCRYKNPGRFVLSCRFRIPGGDDWFALDQGAMQNARLGMIYRVTLMHRAAVIPLHKIAGNP